MNKHERNLADLERIGDAVLKRHNSNNPYYEVDIEYIIEHGYSIKIEPVALKVRLPIEAFPCLGGNIIYVDIGVLNSTIEDKIQERRYRFTLAEELSHVILHKEIYKDVKNLEDYLRVEKTIPNGEYDRLHSNAKMLAGIILMPMYPFINRAVEIRDDLCKLGGAKKEDLAN